MIDDINLYIKLVEVGSFGKLAKLLKINQSTVSSSIQNLEANLT